ncbi:MAG: PD-(D/E)XK nuclease family protein [Actinomycetota bacterium]|nr:PD-(D/E)XK nuclease family protein [Actinomycetota bacterium]
MSTPAPALLAHYTDEPSADVASHLVPLSPSRACDYKTCPQLFKFRAIDRLPEPSDVHKTKGTLVHAALEQLYLLEPENRTLDRAKGILGAIWDELKADPEYASLPLAPQEEAAWLEEAERLLANYFRMEDPSRVLPHEMEWWVQHETERTLLRGIIDRVEIDSDGEWILTDYKTGRAPSVSYALGSFFGLKFYALVCWRAFGKLPKELRLIHLKEPEVITLVPTPQMLKGMERQLDAISDAIARAHEKNDWRPRPNQMCSWCPHRSICPAFAGAAGGTSSCESA